MSFRVLQAARLSPRLPFLPSPLGSYYSTASKARNAKTSSSSSSSARPPPPPSKASTSTAAGPSTISKPEISSHAKPWVRPEPPLVERARKKTVAQRNVWESYLVLDPKTRLYFSLAVMAFALVGLYGGDWLVPETEEEKVLKGEE